MCLYASDLSTHKTSSFASSNIGQFINQPVWKIKFTQHFFERWLIASICSSHKDCSRPPPNTLYYWISWCIPIMELYILFQLPKDICYTLNLRSSLAADCPLVSVLRMYLSWKSFCLSSSAFLHLPKLFTFLMNTSCYFNSLVCVWSFFFNGDVWRG